MKASPHYEVVAAVRIEEDVAFKWLPPSEPTVKLHFLLEHRRHKNEQNVIVFETLTLYAASTPPVLWSTDVPDYELGTHPKVETFMLKSIKDFLNDGGEDEIETFIKGGKAAIQQTLYDIPDI